jgi:hypothetical protein
MLTGGITACISNYDDINKNPYEVTDDELNADGYKIRAALTGMQGYVIPIDANLFQFVDCLLGGTYGGYLADSNDGFNDASFAKYNPKSDWNRAPFNNIIPQIYTNYTQLKAFTDDPVLLSVGDITRVIALLRITDIHGPIPYSKIGQDAALTAPYDSQQEIYTKMFEELDNAITVLTANRTKDFSPKADRVYKGKVENWIKLANSLKLRMALRIVYADPTTAKAKAEEVANHEVGAFSSNADNAFIETINNPFRIVTYDWNGGDSRMSADIISYMKGYKDPRLSKYATTSTFGVTTITDGYHGLRSGIGIPSGVMSKYYSNMVVETNSSLLWMNAAEVAFLKAEGALYGWNMGGTAESFYQQGITLSFDQWGASGAGSYIGDATSTPAAYVDPLGAFSYTVTSSITIKWDDASTSEQNLERIITQKWIANFPLGLEAWAEFRRTGYPKLIPVADNKSGGTVNSDRMARRLSYPDTEYTENAANMPRALQLLGGPDTMGTSVWWDKK